MIFLLSNFVEFPEKVHFEKHINLILKMNIYKIIPNKNNEKP